MNPTVKLKLIKALKSGKYRQTKCQLRNRDRFCVLGVLCNLHAQAHPDIASAQKNKNSYMGSSVTLPDKVRKWAGMSAYEVSILVNLNDLHKFTFSQISYLLKHIWK